MKFLAGVPVQFLLNALIVISLTTAALAAGPGDIITFAGGGVGDNGPATSASLNYPGGVAVDSSGNFYIADTTNQRIRKVSSGGTITTVAGNGIGGFSGDGGQATFASLSNPSGVAVDGSGNLYIADQGNQRIRMVSAGGTITTVAGSGTRGYSGDGGPATSANFWNPVGVAVDGNGNLYIADSNNNRIRMVSAGGTITTVAGNGGNVYSGDGGPAASASLSYPYAVAIDGSGNLYIADLMNRRIRKVSADGTITTVAGNGTPVYSGDGGPAASASLQSPYGVAVDGGGNFYIADYYNQRTRKVSADGTITTVAGNGANGFSGDGGPAASARLSYPSGVAMDGSGNLYIADQYNQRIRMVSAGGTITTVAGSGATVYFGDSGPATSASLSNPSGVVVDGGGNLYIADPNNNRIRKVSAGGTISTVAGNGIYGFSGDGGPAASASLSFPFGVATDGGGNLYIADSNNNRIRKVSAEGTITTVAGNGAAGFSGDGGPAISASFSFPIGVAVDSGGNLYIADLYNHRIRKVSAGGTITTVAGNGIYGFSGDGGPATSASLLYPYGLAVDGSGNLYIADDSNQRIRKVSAGGTITTVAGNGTTGFSGDGGPATSASFLHPEGVAVDGSGNLYIADSNNRRIRKVSAGGTITTVAGNGGFGLSGDGGPAASATLSYAQGVAIDGSGNLYIADSSNNRIRKVIKSDPTSAALTFSPAGPYPSGVEVTVTATFNDLVADAPAPQITISGNSSDMTKVDYSHYTSTFTTGAGGVYTVMFFNVNDLNGNAIASIPTSGGIFTVNNPPVANTGGPYAIEVGQGISLNATASSDPDAASGDSIASYSWDINNDGTFGDATGVTPALTWGQLQSFGISSPGTYTIKLQITDAFGATSTDTTTLNVYGTSPIALFTTNPNPSACNQMISFNASSSGHQNPTKSIVSYAWDFGDGTANGSGVATAHAYSLFGFYTATLTITDNSAPARTASTTHTVTVSQGNRAPVANAGGPYSFIAYNGIQLNAGASSDPDSACGDSIVSYQWDLNNDGTYDLSGVNPSISWAQLQAFGLSSPGVYPIVLRVIDTFGATGSVSTTITVLPDTTPPTAAISYSPAGPYKFGDAVTLTADFSEPLADNPVMRITISAVTGGNSLPASNMTKVSATRYTYTYTVSSGNGMANVNLSTGTDLAGNVVTASPTSGGSFTVIKTPASVALSGLTQTYDGNPKSAIATTTPPGLTTDLTYNGTASVPTNAGSYEVVAAINDASYQGTANGTLVIGKAPQSITFAPLPAQTIGASPFALVANASSGLPVSFASSQPAVATVSGGTVTIVGVGSTIITASQGGNGNYLAAADVPRTLTVNYAATPPTLTISALADGSVTRDNTLNITGSATGINGIKTLTINDTAVTLAGDGSFSQAYSLTTGANSVTTVATDNAGLAAADSRTITLDQTAPTLTVTAPPDNSKINKSFVDVTGTVDENSTVDLKVNNGSTQSATMNGTSFSSTVNLAAGINTIDITATDLAGNTANAKRTVTSDTGAPSLAVTDPAQDITTNQAGVTIQGTVTDALTAVTITITADGQTYTPQVTNGSFIQAITLTASNTYAVTVTAMDEAGNQTSVQRNIIYIRLATGDINADGNVTIADALMALKIAVGLIQMDTKYLFDGDVAPYSGGKPQPDGRIDISDALVILKRCVGLVIW